MAGGRGGERKNSGEKRAKLSRKDSNRTAKRRDGLGAFGFCHAPVETTIIIIILIIKIIMI